ncbi:hypothetical protein K9L97_01745 [Candidatus Woesearchaeota archaeon]|nr:hypothetical protein [Candidatus Woesearchaeota archaeon]
MQETISKSKTEENFDRSLTALGLSMEMKTNPELIAQILQEMRLDEFQTNFEPMNLFFRNVLDKPQSLTPIFQNIASSLEQKHPAIIEFADLCLKNNWFKKSEHVIYSVNVLYILEKLTSAMCNNHDFFMEIHNHYRTQEKKLGLDTIHPISTFFNALKMSRDYFKIAKSFSLDPLMIYSKILRGLDKSRISKKELKNMFKNKELNYVEYKLLSKNHEKHAAHILELVGINIYEAGITEYKNGLKVNSISAHELSEDLVSICPKTIFKNKNIYPENNKSSFYTSVFDSNNLFPTVEVSQEWASLYTSWNMAFILGDLTDLDMIFPKLFLPSLLDSNPEDFLGVRFISLWLSINHVIYRKDSKKEITGPSNKREMSQAWGEINKKYAFKIAKKELHEDSKVLMKHYNKFFSHPFFNLLKLIVKF